MSGSICVAGCRALLRQSFITSPPGRPLPCIQQIRHKSKINIQRPKLATVDRRILVAITSPIYDEVKPDPVQTCTRRLALINEAEKLTRYDEFLVKEQKKKFEMFHQGVMAFFFQNSTKKKVYRKNLVALRKQGFEISRINRRVLKYAVGNTKYSTICDAIGFSTVLVTHPEPQVAQLLSCVKSMHNLNLLFAIVEDHLLSKSQVLEYSRYPDKLGMLAQTCAILGGGASNTSRLLSQQQETLVRNLETYSKGD